MKVEDSSILSFDSQGNWTAHKAGITKVYPSFPNESSEHLKEFEEELVINPVELYVNEISVVWEVTVEESEQGLESSSRRSLIENDAVESLSETTPSSMESSVRVSDTNEVDGSNAPTMIFGSDNMIPIENTTVNPYRKVVAVYKVVNGLATWNGSGVMIAPNKVLTAAHVVRDFRTNETYDQIMVAPAQNGNKYPYNKFTGSTYHFFTSYLDDATLGYTRTKANEDIAVVTLDSSIASVGFLPVTSILAINDDITVIGYPQDRGVVMHKSGGKVKSIDGKIIGYQNDTLSGNSGGPVLDRQNRIVAINVAEPKIEGGYTEEYLQKYGANTGRKIDQDAMRLIDVALHNRKTGDGISASVPTYRLYNDGLKYHLYTKDKNEVDILSGRDWIYEGVIFHSSGKRPVYRLYNSGLKVHLYTSDKNEYNVLSTHGWKQEGVAWNVE